MESLKEHMKTHGEEGSFSVEDCQTLESNHESMAGHPEEHREKRLFKCKKCELTFASKNTLQMHVENRHSGGRVQKTLCHICNEWFVLQKGLASHIRRKHSGNTRNVKFDDTYRVEFYCPMCRVYFGNEHERRAHVNEFHVKDVIRVS